MKNIIEEGPIFKESKRNCSLLNFKSVELKKKKAIKVKGGQTNNIIEEGPIM